MRRLCVVELKVLRQLQQQLAHRGVARQVHSLVLHRAPQPLHKNVVERTTPPVLADADIVCFEHPGERVTGELATLIAVEHFGLAVFVDGSNAS